MSNKYRVKIADAGCERCGQGASFIVVDPTGIGSGMTWLDRSEAEAQCDSLNHAYQLGQQARLAPIREVWEKYKQNGSYWADAFVTISAYGSSVHDMRAVFQECWQAIEAACKEEQP